ncbi:histidine phosphatase family protein [Candidatus Phaeomarinobacter ectocarpi]|uniref:histidine phosphatase family protein n=1 Tax=Candidatus Phaeomarinibacter ectocarpi TaxID=1458461 RepID=UPI001FCBA7E0|nr:histidine phosphatase family protein [Candidatus Phaeomarinobacter ectocarpi]
MRHAKAGQPTGVPEPDWPLTDEGERQAEALASFLAAQGIDHIYASPFLRVQQTVAPTANRTGDHVHILEDLKERRLAETPIDDFVSALRDSFTDDTLRLPGGETLIECRTRVRRVIDHISARHAGQTIAVCSHGAAIASLISDLDDVDGFDLWQSLTNPHVIELTVHDGTYGWRNIGGEDAYV